jgi:Zn-dependent M28 family amino/carboxypeptidase
MRKARAAPASAARRDRTRSTGAALVVAACLTGCGGAADSNRADAGDPIRAVFDAVDEARIRSFLDDLTGGEGFSNRWSPDAKAKFRAYWQAKMESFGATTEVIPFPIADLVGETEGHDVEAVLRGSSADSLVIIVHYDSVGAKGKETENPAADDDGSGLAMQLEAARIFAAAPQRAFTVRFVAADYEEISNDLKGDFAYVAHLRKKAAAEHFTILAASDDDQTGWSCWSEHLCPPRSPPRDSTFRVIACSGDKHDYDYPDLSKGMVDVAARYGSPITPTPLCDGSGDTDHYPFWVAGIPAYVIEEWGAARNPHYDQEGHDTLEHIDYGLLTGTARIQIAFQAQLAGIGAP